MKTIITPVLRFWGFKRHPFDDRVLNRAELELFVDRKTEVRRLQNALSNPLSGVFGAQGVGKSSVLNKLSMLTREEGYSVVHVQMSGTSENVLYREILAAVLREIKVGRVKVLTRMKLKVDQELERVEHSIQYTSAVEATGETGWKALMSLGLKTGITQTEEHSLEKHTEETALTKIRKIAENKKDPFVIIVDNLERAKFLLNDEDVYFRFITKFAQTIDGVFSDLGVPFVVTLDQSFADRIDDHLPGAEEAYSFSFGQLVEVSAFPPRDFFEIIARRLECRKWSGTVGRFIKMDAFWALVAATGGHPRRAFAVLREAMELIAEKNAGKTIELEHMLIAVEQCGEKLNQKDVLIFKFLDANRAYSSSDPNFIKEVGLSRAQLHNRLQELQKRGLLCVEEEVVGKSKRDVYFIEESRG